MFKRKEFERTSPESVGIRSQDIMWLLDKLEGDFTEPHGLIIMRNGKICSEGWWAPYSPGIRHGQQSHSKTYAATAVGIAYTEGLLTLDERIIDIFPKDAPEKPSENLKKLTVRDVLCMGCGMDEMPRPTKDWIKAFLATPVNHMPGTTYMYNSTGSTLLGAIVKKKTGLGLHEYLKPRLYDKIGIFSDNHKWFCMPDGMEVGGGGLFATTEDNLRLMKLYADNGICNGEVILNSEYVKLATTVQNESATESINNPTASDNFLGYGYQIWMCKPEGVYRADGAMGQFTIVVPSLDMIIAITENASGKHWGQATLDVFWEFLDKITNNQALPENPVQSEKLKKRMERLSLPRPKFAPYSNMSYLISGKEYQVTKGKFHLANIGMGQMMSGLAMPDSISKFSLEFKSDCCDIRCQIGNEVKIAAIALDGSRRWNEIDSGCISQALLSGAWIAENEFELTIRWVETCGEQKYVFTFDKNIAVIKVDYPKMFSEAVTDIIKCEMI